MDYPKVQLHCHLDGAIPPHLFVKYCREDGYVPEGMDDQTWVNDHVITETMTLSDAMKQFGLLTAILQVPERLEELTEAILDQFYEEGSRLVELRFSPQSHIQKEMSMEDAVCAVIKGQKKALEKHPDLVAGILLCMMNHGQNLGNEENNRKTVELAKKYLDQGVVGIDLAGDELATPIEIYAPQFELARELGVPYTIHAGESGPASNVQFALDQDATRIGHGIHSVEDQKVVDNIKEKGTLLEISVTSNMLSRCVPSIPEHPIRKLFDQGIKMNINTDDPALMGIDLEHEYELLKNTFGFTEKELIQTNLDSAKASFCKDKDKVVQALEECLEKA